MTLCRVYVCVRAFVAYRGLCVYKIHKTDILAHGPKNNEAIERVLVLFYVLKL